MSSPAASASAAPQPGKRHPKKSAFSCEPCRKRKVKCGAEQPRCDRCKARGDECIYKLSPTLSYTQRLEKQVADLQAALARQTSATPSVHDTRFSGQSPDTASPADFSAKIEDLNIDENERLSLHGSTSLFRLPSNPQSRAQDTRADEEIAARKESLLNSAWRERAFERLADTPEPFRSLLDSHFCWIQPLFNFVYRPAFTRDMKTDGPYFSQALLNAILCHSVRWCRGDPGMEELLAPFDHGASFAQNAVTYLFEDIRLGRNKIPTVQALLLLSARACGKGDRSQAWLFSGMAFRMIDDMGICVDGHLYAGSDQLSTEDIEIRHRLFWSCYFWDKLISLYFGRSPMIQKSEISPPRVLMDDTAEIEPWEPHGLASSNYPPKQAHSISCFIQMCSLADTLNQILLHLYSPSRESTTSRAYQCAKEEQSRMRDWWRDLPLHLKINLTNQQLACPPGHIVILNCLYHTINILLNRGLLKLSRETGQAKSTAAEHNPLIQCISSATSIVALYDLYTRTFGTGHVVLSLAYSVYTAASIFLLEVQAIGHAAPTTLERLSICLSALTRLQNTNPVITTAATLITKEVEMLGLRLPESRRSPNEGGRPTNAPSKARQQSNPHTFLPLLPVENSLIDQQSSQHAFMTVPMDVGAAEQNQYDDSIFLDASYMNSDQMDGAMNLNLMDLSPEMFEAFLQAEPISANMNAGFDVY